MTSESAIPIPVSMDAVSVTDPAVTTDAQTRRRWTASDRAIVGAMYGLVVATSVYAFVLDPGPKPTCHTVRSTTPGIERVIKSCPKP